MPVTSAGRDPERLDCMSTPYIESSGEVMALPAHEENLPVPLPARQARHVTVVALLLSDLGALTLGLGLACWLQGRLQLWLHLPAISPDVLVSVFPLIGIFPLAYEAGGLYHGTVLYPGVALGPAEELRRVWSITTLVHFGVLFVFLFFDEGHRYPRFLFIFSWGLALALVPAFRIAVRKFFSRYAMWGAPAVILGAGDTGTRVTFSLLAHPEFGTRPVALLDDDPEKQGTTVHGVPVVGPLSRAPELARKHGIRHAILAMPSLEWRKLTSIAREYAGDFPHLLFIPETEVFSSMWVTAQDVAGMLGLEVRQNLLLRGPRFFKRSLDYLLAVVLGIGFLPVMGLCALLIKLTSQGPAIFRAQRMGRNGEHFEALKFRTMYEDGDAMLEEYFARHPDKRDEWKSRHKIRNDPRVTWVGRILRMTSLDELPQFWNVLRGEMSVVGPRPIVDSERGFYGENFSVYCRVRPGISGLWQVSGRSDTSYEDRVRLDVYYVRNWSFWLDIYILLKTVKAVLSCSGAY